MLAFSVDILTCYARTIGRALLPLVTVEQQAYRDILLLNYSENMNAGKTFNFFKWAASKAPLYTFVAKMDDDVFLHPANFQARLRVLPRTNLYFGRPIPLFNDSRLSWFHQGMLYVISMDVVKRIATEMKQQGSFEGEDVLAGRWMVAMGIVPSTWQNATPAEFYESIHSASGAFGTPQGWWKRASYQNETIGIHLLKSPIAIVHAYQHFRPTMSVHTIGLP